MPETIESVETMEQVEVQNTNGGFVSTFVAGALGAAVFIAGSKLGELAWNGLQKCMAKRANKMTVDGGKNQDNSEANVGVKDETN